MQNHKVINIAPIVLFIFSLCCLCYFVPYFIFSPQANLDFIISYAFIPGFFSFKDRFYTAITYSLLHGSLSHLVFNMIWLIVFGTPLANRLGSIKFLFFWFISAVASVMAYYMLFPHEMSPVIGASGSISALIGAGTRYGFVLDEYAEGKAIRAFSGPVPSIVDTLKRKNTYGLLIFWILSNLFIGVFPQIVGENGVNIAWEAHIAGLIFGFFFIAFLDRKL